MTGWKKTILIVDDVPDDIAILEGILKADYQVKAVTNGPAALAVARGNDPPDLMLLDIMMPGMDGFEVCRNLKQDSAGSTIPVIFLTAKVLPTDEKIGLELGAADYIRKPVDPEIVRSRIKAHLELKEQILRTSEVKYRRLFETAKDGIMIVDGPSGAVIDVNPSMAAMMGLSQESFLGKKASDLEFLKTILSQYEGLTEAQRRAYVRYKDLPLATYDGRQIFVEFISNGYKVNDRDVLQLNVREITDLVLAERERDALSAKLSHYLATSPTVTYSMQIEGGEARMRWISENVLGLLGYDRDEALEPDWWFRNIKSSDRAAALSIVSESTRRGTASREYRFTRKDRSLAWIYDEMRLVPGKGAELEIVGTLTDISEMKEAEEEIRLKSEALEAAANAVVITDRDGVVRWANKAFYELSGYSSDEAIGKRMGALAGSGRQDAEFYRRLWDAILSGSVWKGQLVNRRKSGETYIEEMTITPVLDEERRVGSFIAVKNDITASVRNRERLEQALLEKNTLLREVHHRVKNNMQVIISLLNISATQIPDPAFQSRIDDITKRLHAMALIHEQFYQARDISRIDFAAYLRQLVESAEEEFRELEVAVVVSPEDGPVFLNLEQAIPAGLVASELVLNALKHAFVGRSSGGRMDVSQKVGEDGVLILSVADDGRGLPAEVAADRAPSLGMMLMRTLAEQLGGKIEFHSGKGTTAILSFKIE